MEHCGRIGSALWEFVWCLDKITEERDGTGIVLGGAPVKIRQIAADLDRGEHTVRRNLDRLEGENYISRTRTPYGFSIRVRNSQKFQIWSKKENVINGQSVPKESVQKRPVSLSHLADLTVKNGRNKEDAVVDSTVDAVAAAAPWKAIGESDLPMGSPRFWAKWVFFYSARNGNSISEAMERCIVNCRKSSVIVPAPFFEAKREVERREARERTAAPDRPELEELAWRKR